MEKESDLSTVENASEPESTEHIFIFTKDKKLRTIDEKTASKCLTIKNQIDEMRERKIKEEKDKNASSEEKKDEAGNEKEQTMKDILSNSIELATVPALYFDKIFEFIGHYERSPYEELPKPLPSSYIEDVLEDEYYIKFCEQSFDEIKNYFDHAMYLDYKPLITLMAARIAAEIKEKSIDEIRKMFDIENDFSEEEYKKIEEEMKMLDEIPVVDE